MNYRSECKLPQLVKIGSCSLHTVHGALKRAVESTSWKIKQKLTGKWQILHESPARREDIESVTGTNKYPLFFCSTRLVKNKSVADRAIEIWPSIYRLVEFWEKLLPSKRPKSKSFLNVQEVVKDSLKLLKLDFLHAYQTDKPMVPFMHNELESYQRTC